MTIQTTGLRFSSNQLVTGTLCSLLALAVACSGSDDNNAGDDQPVGDGDTGDGDTGDGDTGDGDTGDGDTGDGDTGDGDNNTPESLCESALVDLQDYENTVTNAEIISDGQWSSYVRAMEGVGEDMYVLTNDGLHVIRGDATVHETITTDVPEFPISTLSDGSGYLRIDETHAYFVTKAGIARTGLEDGTTEEIFTGLESNQVTTDLILLDDVIYFGLYNLGIHKMPKDGSTAPELITDELEFLGMTIVDGNIYGANSNTYLATMPLAGGTPTTLSTFASGILPHVERVKVVGSSLYWSDGGSLVTCTLPACNDAAGLGVGAGNDFQIIGGRVYASGDSIFWKSLTDDSCGTLVHGDWPDTFDASGFTEKYVYISGGLAGFGTGQEMIRLRLDAQ